MLSAWPHKDMTKREAVAAEASSNIPWRAVLMSPQPPALYTEGVNSTALSIYKCTKCTMVL